MWTTGTTWQASPDMVRRATCSIPPLLHHGSSRFGKSWRLSIRCSRRAEASRLPPLAKFPSWSCATLAGREDGPSLRPFGGLACQIRILLRIGELATQDQHIVRRVESKFDAIA